MFTSSPIFTSSTFTLFIIFNWFNITRITFLFTSLYWYSCFCLISFLCLAIQNVLQFSCLDKCHFWTSTYALKFFLYSFLVCFVEFFPCHLYPFLISFSILLFGMHHSYLQFFWYASFISASCCSGLIFLVVFYLY